MKRAAELFKRRLRDPRRERDALDRLIPGRARAPARAQADVIIEAIFENLEAKRALFAKLEADGQARRDPRHQHLEPQARRHRHGDFKDPSRLVGIHFFNPVPQMQLVEVVSS